MSHLFTVNLKAGVFVEQYFLLRQVRRGLTRDNKPFQALVLGDKEGQITARMWEEVLKKFSDPLEAGQVVFVRGKVDSYKDELQIIVEYIKTKERLEAEGVELKNYDSEVLVPVTPYNRTEMWRELLELAVSRINPPLQDLVLAILQRYEAQFTTWPGAEIVHHAYLGGLLEHTWSMARHAQRSLEIYPTLNNDLVLAGVILHDLGKLKELANPECPRRTAHGGLVGHIVLGWEMVREEARDLDFPDENLLRELEHIIISHHGSEEFGSPVLPKTPEALLVYYLDEVDAKLHMAERHLQTDSGDGDFTAWHRHLERRLYKSPSLRDAFLEPEAEPDA
jgi:3'-5' exoribonuclease